MKKALLIVLALCLVLSLAACGAKGDPKPTDPKKDSNGIVSDHQHCVCVSLSKGVGAHTACSDKDGWEAVATAAELEAKFNALTAGKACWVYLTADMTLEGLSVYLPKDATVNLCLNGKTLTTGAMRNLGTMNITDCQHNNGEFTGKIVGNRVNTIAVYGNTSLNIYGGNLTNSLDKTESRVIYANGASDEGVGTTEGRAVVTLYNGKIYRDTESHLNGANVYLGDQSELYMYSGVITGAYVNNLMGKLELDRGGNIAVIGTASKFFMYGGTVSDGKVEAPSSGKGGNICSHYGELHILGGTISGGTAVKWGGGNICVDSGTPLVEIKDATITGGTTIGKWGGNIYINSSKATVTIENSTISNGVVKDNSEPDRNFGTNIYVNGSDSTLIKDCTISGGVGEGGGAICGKAGTVITLAGNMVFTGNQKSDIKSNVGSAGELTFNVAGLTSTGDIIVSGSASTFTSDKPANSTFKAAEGYVLTEVDGKLRIEPATPAA